MSKTKMMVATWQLIRGDTQTAPLLSYEDGEELGICKQCNLKGSQTDGGREPHQRTFGRVQRLI